MAAFLVIAALMSIAALGLVLPALVRSTPSGNAVSRRAANAVIHAAELDGLERELADGRITLEAHQAARDEILRRVLVESDADAAQGEPAADRMPAAAVTLAVPLIAAALYLLVGNPGALTQGSDAQSAQASSITVHQLEAHLRHTPRDGRAWILLARMHMEESSYGAAVRAYEQALASTAKIANDAGIWCELADALGMAQGGTLRGRPRELIEKALALNPAHPRALEMAGSAAYEAGRYAETLEHWTALLSQLPPESALHAELSAAIARVRARAGNIAQSH